MTRIDLVTGILGSGKTTWIKKYASYFIEKGQRIAILENDFGAVNVDMMLLQELAGPKCHLEMVLGGGDPDCHRRRFKSKLIALGMQGFDRVIVEPSGIFYPTNMLINLTANTDELRIKRFFQFLSIKNRRSHIILFCSC